MGRHSASADDEDEELDVLALDDPATVSGRHFRVDAPPAEPPAEPPADPPADPLDSDAAGDGSPGARGDDPPAADVAVRAARGTQSAASDLALLRAHSAVRARVIAAVVVPFVLYTAVLLLIGALGAYLIWVWIPLVTAGVVGGSILDVEHKRRRDVAER